MPHHESAPRRYLAARSNLFLTPELKARVERVAAALSAEFGGVHSSPAIQRMAMDLGLRSLEERLGLPPAAAPESPTPTRERQARVGRRSS